MTAGSSTATNPAPVTGEDPPADQARIPADSSNRARKQVRLNPFPLRILAAVVVLHGLIHLLGAAKGLGWANVSQLKEPISSSMGVAWLMAAVLVVGTGLLLASAVRWWWVVGTAAVLVSQGVILTSWSDALAGTSVNVLLLAAVTLGYALRGSTSISPGPTG